MPTTHARYQVTDTGRVRDLIDLAAAAWPESAGDRKALLLRLAEIGATHLPGDVSLEQRVRAHAGRWVAIRDGQLLTAADDAATVARWLQARGERADELYRVPATAADLGTEHGVG